MTETLCKQNTHITTANTANVASLLWWEVWSTPHGNALLPSPLHYPLFTTHLWQATAEPAISRFTCQSGRVYPPLTALRWSSTLGKPDPHLPFASLLIHSFFRFLSSLFVCQSPPLQVYLSIIPKKPLCCCVCPCHLHFHDKCGLLPGKLCLCTFRTTPKPLL